MAMQATTERAEPIRVVLVDDHEHVLWGLAKLIDGEWPRMMVVGMSSTMAEAQAQLQDRSADAVVLDLKESGANSLDALRVLLAAAGDAAVIVHTATRSPELHRRALAAGVTAVIDKEAPADALLDEIERDYLRRRGSAPEGRARV